MGPCGSPLGSGGASGTFSCVGCGEGPALEPGGLAANSCLAASSLCSRAGSSRALPSGLSVPYSSGGGSADTPGHWEAGGGRGPAPHSAQSLPRATRHIPGVAC